MAVRWWGSHLNGHTEGDIDGYTLSFFSDVPVSDNNPYSHPGGLLGTYVAPASAVRVLGTCKLGWDGHYIYQYEVSLSDTCLEHADPTIARTNAFLESSNVIYWISISAERGCTYTNDGAFWTFSPSGKPPATNYFWGWHTSPCTNLDLSVTGRMTMTFSDWVYGDWRPGGPFHMEWDQAFELLSDVPPLSLEVPEPKWLQRPDTCYGMDILATAGTPSPIVADDWECRASGPITDIHIWGSWLNDRLDPNARFRLRIWENIPDSKGIPSHPGRLLWTNNFPDQLPDRVLLVASNLCEPFYDPATGLGLGIGIDTKIFRYDFFIPPNQAFIQTNGTVYWLSVTAITTNYFGWKTALPSDRFMDDAVFGFAPEPPPDGWTDMHFPRCHPYFPQSIDMAFALTTNLPPVVCPPVTLTISYLPPNMVQLSWPDPSYRLQASPVIVPTTWVNIAGSSPVTLPATGNMRFFRLVCP